MNKKKAIKMLGLIVTAVGFGLELVQRQLDDDKLQNMIEKEVQKQLKKD